MWLLETATAKLHRFNDPEEVPHPGYAILSHVWRKDEQDFQEVKASGERCKRLGKNPRDQVCEKIRRCCEVAHEMGYEWVWIDTCCIDKTSSAELSEAINSMFRYYTLSAVCIVYLDDVENVSDLGWRFECHWKMRGWTLQELIAPTVVVMLSRSWTPIGSKHSLANKLERGTGIPASLLKLESRLSDYSVAQRMSWAALRETTRIEDEAYCLLGIFDINMPTLYGEGRRAFLRLQEEIMKTRLDTTLFAWEVGSRAPMNSAWALQDKTESFPLLARAPRDFNGCSDVVCSPGLGGPEVGLSFKMTPHGIRARVPLLILKGKTFIDLSCTDNHHPIFLRVEQTNKGGAYSVVSPYNYFRTFSHQSQQFLPSGEMAKIYLTNGTSGPDLPHTVGFPCNANPYTPFHFSFTLSVASAGSPTHIKPSVAAQNVKESWKGSPPAVIQIFYRDVFFVVCGICTAQTRSVGSLPKLSSYVHWAHALIPHVPETLERFFSGEHDCTTDHIADWPDGKRGFQGKYDVRGIRTVKWEVELSFVTSKAYFNTLRLCSVTLDHRFISWYPV